MMRFGLGLKTALLFMTLMAPANAQSIGGVYEAVGTNLDGSSYRGTATITLTSSTTCKIRWQTGGTTSQGICMRNGSAFSAAYVLGRAIGLVIYNVQQNGTLQGIWTVAGSEGVGTEILTPR